MLPFLWTSLVTITVVAWPVMPPALMPQPVGVDPNVPFVPTDAPFLTTPRASKSAHSTWRTQRPRR